METIVSSLMCVMVLLRCGDGFEVRQPPQVSVSVYGSASIRCEVTAMSANQQVDDVRLNRLPEQGAAVMVCQKDRADNKDCQWYEENNTSFVFVLLHLDDKDLQETRYECEVTARQEQPVLHKTEKGTPTALIPGSTLKEVSVLESSSPLPLPVPSSSSSSSSSSVPPPLPLLRWILIGLLAVMSLYSCSMTFMYIRLRVTRGEELYDRLTMQPNHTRPMWNRGDLEFNSTYEDMRKPPQRGLHPSAPPLANGMGGFNPSG